MKRITLNLHPDEKRAWLQVADRGRFVTLAGMVRYAVDQLIVRAGVKAPNPRARLKSRLQHLAERTLDVLYDAGAGGMATAAIAPAIKGSHGEAKAVLDALERLKCITRSKEAGGRVVNRYVRDLTDKDVLEETGDVESI